jgi:plastocyanin
MRALKFLLLVLVVALASCQMGALGSNGLYNNGTGSGSMGGTTGMTPSMAISNFQFTPQSDTVPAGTTVTWTNSDGVDHTVTSDTSVFDSLHIASAGTFSVLFSTVGTFHYHCSIHAGMTGTITVTP